MNDSMAQPGEGFAAPLERPGWKTSLAWVSAVLLAILFLASGIWKITDVHAAAIRMAQARVPEPLSVIAALAFGIAETVAGVLVLVPRFRRWGAALAGLLLIAFMIYVGVQYSALRGGDCSCFPWIKRAVGPAFFIGDIAMLILAAIAWMWSRPPESLRSAVLVFGAVTVFALVSFGVATASQTAVAAPATITVNGQPYSLEHGKVFLFFFHPQCMHCFEAAKRMGQSDWGDTRLIAVPVDLPEWGKQFLEDTGLRADVSTDFNLLKETFQYKSYPWGVAIEDGVEKATITNFDGDEPVTSLRELGLIK